MTKSVTLTIKKDSVSTWESWARNQNNISAAVTKLVEKDFNGDYRLE